MEIPVPYNNIQILTIKLKKLFQQERKTKTKTPVLNKKPMNFYMLCFKVTAWQGLCKRSENILNSSEAGIANKDRYIGGGVLGPSKYFQ